MFNKKQLVVKNAGKNDEMHTQTRIKENEKYYFECNVYFQGFGLEKTMDLSLDLDLADSDANQNFSFFGFGFLLSYWVRKIFRVF